MARDDVVKKDEAKKNKDEIKKVITNLIDRGANYSIKSMSVSDHIKEMLMELKESIIDSNFKKMLDKAIDGAIKDGEEINKEEYDEKDINSLTEKAFEGGLPNFLNLAIDLVASAKKKGNIFSNYIEEFVDRMQGYISSPTFKTKVNNGIAKCKNKVEKFKGLCTAWYNAYDVLNIEQIKEIAKELKSMRNKVRFDSDCLNENETIQNITDIITKKQEKISRSRMDIYDNLHEI